jgi:hypothetical protein
LLWAKVMTVQKRNIPRKAATRFTGIFLHALMQEFMMVFVEMVCNISWLRFFITLQFKDHMKMEDG